MLRKGRRIQAAGLAGVLAATALLSGCGGTLISTTGMEDRPPLENAVVYDLDDIARSGVFGATEEERGALAQMEKLLENEYLALYMGPLCDIVVEDKETGALFFSNRAAYDEELRSSLTELGTARSLSQVTLEYYDQTDSFFELTSYPECIDGAEKKQAEVTVDGDTVTVTYLFGEETANICSAFTVEDFEALEQASEAAIAAGQITKIDFARFSGAYMRVEFDKLDAVKSADYLKRFPAIKSLGEMYVLKDTTTDTIKEVVSRVSKALGIDAAYIDEEMQKLGASENAVGNTAFFKIPVTYRLDGRDFLAGIDTAQIVAGEGYMLTRIYLLGGFGAALPEEEGYLFIPDNSGAIIENGQTAAGMSSLDIPFYGSDFSIDRKTGDAVDPYAPFPVFGVKAGSRAVFGVAEAGEALGGVVAQVPDGVTPYNAVMPYVTYLVQDSDSYGELSGKESNNLYSASGPGEEFRIRYHFLYGDSSTYSGMARYYRAYLRQTGALGGATVQDTLPLTVQFLGAITKKEMRFGIPMEVLSAASTFEEAEAFAAALREKGVGPVNYVFQGAVNGGMAYKIPTKLHFEKVLGGEEGFRALSTALESAGSRLSLSVDFTRVYSKGNGLDDNAHIAGFLNKKPAVYAGYDPASLKRQTEGSGYLLNPMLYIPLAQEFAADYDVNTNIHVPSLAAYLSGNYKENYFVTRQQSLNLTAGALKTLEEAGFRITADGANAYALRYVDFLTDIPVDYSEYAMETAAVPFVGMVLHGAVDYCGPVLNSAGNYPMALLKTLESGAGLNYLLMTGDPLMLSGTDSSDLYNVSSEEWLDTIAETYADLSSVYAALRGQTMEEHERLGGDVVCVTYSGGARLWINYGDSPYESADGTVEALSYRFAEG